MKKYFKLTNFLVIISVMLTVIDTRPVLQEQDETCVPKIGLCSMISSTTLTFVGLLTLIQDERMTLTISGTVSNLPKTAQIGFHVHEFGNFSDPKNICDSTGSHFNPLKVQHGCPGDGGPRHAGDLGNIITNGTGISKIYKKSTSLSLNQQNIRGILGRAIVIHSQTDDCGLGGTPTSLTNGNSGKRIACCIIGIGKNM